MKMEKKQQNRRENAYFKPSSTTLWMGVVILIGLFSVNFASAITWDTISYYKLDEQLELV